MVSPFEIAIKPEELDIDFNEKRTRSENFTFKDLQILSRCYEKYSKILDTTNLTVSLNCRERRTAWSRLVFDYNKFAQQRRTVAQIKAKLKQCWHEINRYRTKVEYQKVAGGPAPQELSAPLKKLAALRSALKTFFAYNGVKFWTKSCNVFRQKKMQNNETEKKEKRDGTDEIMDATTSNFIANNQETESEDNIATEKEQEKTTTPPQQLPTTAQKPLAPSKTIMIHLTPIEEQQLEVWQAKKLMLDLKIRNLKLSAQLRQEREIFEMQRVDFGRERMEFERQKMDFEIEKIKFEQQKLEYDKRMRVSGETAKADGSYKFSTIKILDTFAFNFATQIEPKLPSVQ
uniref:Regulatory protein zeste n=1 Tax=Romanomermis culicivorax TaxID=13658 RepID=A0A915K7D8_ROMCU